MMMHTRSLASILALLVATPFALGLEFKNAALIGGSGRDVIVGIAQDPDGFVYVAGRTTSPNLPVSSNAFRQIFSGPEASFVIKLGKDLRQVVWATYFPNKVETITVDRSGNVYLAGVATSSFPVTINAFQRTVSGGNDLFIAKVSADGSSLLYSTLLGGSDNEAVGYGGRGHALAVTTQGEACLCGQTTSSDFPGSPVRDRAQGGEVFIVKLSADGTSLKNSVTGVPVGVCNAILVSGDAVVISGQIYTLPSSTTTFVARYFGRTMPDFETKFPASTYHGRLVSGLAVSPSNDYFLLGETASAGFPVTSGVYRTIFSQTTGAAVDTFIALLSNLDGRVKAATFLDVLPPAFDSHSNFSIGVLPSGSVVVAGLGSPTLDARFGARYSSSQVIVLSADLTRRLDGGWTDISLNLPTITERGILLSASLPSGDIARADLSPGVDDDAAVSTFDLNPPSPKIVSVRQAATGAIGVLAPGSILSLYGTDLGPIQPQSAFVQGLAYPLSIGETSVRIATNGPEGSPFPAVPLLYAARNQVNAVLPSEAFWASVPGAPRLLFITRNGVNSDPIRPASAPFAPGIFTSDGSGGGQAASLNENGQVNNSERPASRNNVISIFATGLGPLQTSQAGGVVASTAVLLRERNISVNVGGVQSTVLYAGTAPGLVIGAYQINFRIPPNAPVGDFVPVILRVGSESSPPGPTIAIRE